MLEYIEKAAYCDNEEISTGAMDSLQELLESQPVSDAETLALGKFFSSFQLLCPFDPNLGLVFSLESSLACLDKYL